MHPVAVRLAAYLEVATVLQKTLDDLLLVGIKIQRSEVPFVKTARAIEGVMAELKTGERRKTRALLQRIVDGDFYGLNVPLDDLETESVRFVGALRAQLSQAATARDALIDWAAAVDPE